MSDIEEMANTFAEKTGTKLAVLDYEYKPMWSEKQSRYVFKCRLTRGRKSYTFEFGQSIANGSQKPTMYDVLACMSKPCGIDTFEDFCDEFGYDYDSRRAERTWKGYQKEVAAMERLFGDVMDELYEIN